MLGLIHHSTKGASCMREVTAVLSNCRVPLTMTEIRTYTGCNWELSEISSVLAKLVAAEAVTEADEVPVPEEKYRGGRKVHKTWVWSGT